MPKPVCGLTYGILLWGLAGLVACGGEGGGGTTGPSPGGDAAASQTCSDLALGRSSATPLDTVDLTGLPDSLETPVSALVATSADTGRTFVDRTATGEGFLIAPLVPGGAVEGGEVTLQVTDGQRACDPVEFTVEPLPEASGTFASAVDSMERIVELKAQRLGVDPGALRGVALDTLPRPLWPLAIAREMIDGPDNPNSLRAVLEGSAPVLDGDSFRAELTDGLLARTGILEGLSSQLEAMRQRVADSTSASRIRRSTQSSATRLACDPPDVDTPALLDTCMGIQYSAAFDDEHMQDVNTVIGTGIGVAGLVPGAGQAAFAAGALFFLHTKVIEGTARLLPSHFVAGDFELTKHSYLEDEPGPDQWQNAWVKAASDGWTVDQTIMSALLQLLGGAGAYDDYINGFLKESSLTKDVADFVGTTLMQEAVNATDGSDVLTIPADTTPRDTIDAEQWSRQEIYGDAVAFTDHRTYAPRAVGEAQVYVGTAGDEFPGANYDMEKKSVQVKQIDVDVTPPDASARPGEVRTFEVVVSRAWNPAVDVDVSAGQHAVVSTPSDSVYEVEVTTPADRSLFPVYLTAAATSDTGARAHSDERRVGQADVLLSGTIRVTPSQLCLEYNESQQFTATVAGLDDESVTWSASRGRIGADGVFTAPSSDGDVTVTATSEVDSEVTGSALVMVREDCGNWWVVRGFGRTATGTDVEPDFPDDGPITVELGDTFENPDAAIAALNFHDPVIHPDVPPGHAAVVVSFLEDGKFVNGTPAICPDTRYGFEDIGYCTVRSIEETEERVTVYVSGPAAWTDGDVNIRGFLDVTFSYRKPR